VTRGASALACAFAASVLAGCAASEPPPPAYAPPPGAWSGPPPAAWNAPLAVAPFQSGRASFYSDRLAGRATATGEPYDPGAYTAAHRTLPLGAVVHVAREDGRAVIVRINDRGPYSHGRILDLSRRAAAELGMLRDGVATVALRVLWIPPAPGPRVHRM
jgi:rare lipoprotein A